MKRKSAPKRRVNEGSKPPVIIKKYSDRRLYDSSASRYVKLEDVARMVRDGAEVKVVDARSGKDLTHLVLTQIILEHARERETALPLQFLQQLVKASDQATHEFLSWYLNSTLELFQKVQSRLRTRIPEAKAVVARPIEFVRGLLGEHPWPPSAAAPDSAEVERLRRRIEQLETRLNNKKPRSRRARQAS